MMTSLALLVVIVVDQYRTDELLRAQRHLNPAGIGRLVNQGIFYDDAHHTQFFNMTCPGHASISTGAPPGLNGIILNDGWDEASQKPVYCVSDPSHHLIESPQDDAAIAESSIGTSAKRLLATTVGDEVKHLWPTEAKVVSVSLKDRAAILMAGHAADGVYWLSPKGRKWTTSDAYLKSATLPQWLEDFNKEHKSDTKSDEDYALSAQAINDTTDLALTAAKAEKLGDHPRPDVLWVSYSTHDFVGHDTGDDSPEMKATITAEDDSIARLITDLKKRVGNKKIMVAFTADHGAGVDITKAAKINIPGGRFNDKATKKNLNQCLKDGGVSVSGGGDAVAALFSMNAYLSNKVKDRGQARIKLKDCMTKLKDPVWSAFTLDEILSNQLPQVPWLKNLAASTLPSRAADVVGIMMPYWNSNEHKPVNHETSFDYDSWVPLILWWPGAPHKLIHRRVNIPSLAPTLARVLETRRPSGATDELLVEVLDAIH